MSEEIKTTCLHDRHVALGAQMSPFAGFDMPIQYSGIVEEHNAVRNACGVFDVSHMGEVFVEGDDAERFVNHIFTNDVAGMPVGKILYGMMLYDNGTTVDDLLVYRIEPKRFLLVINAANIDKDVEWILARSRDDDYKIVIEHASDRFGQIAVQGPEAEAVLHDVLGIDGEELAFYTSTTIFSDTGDEIIVSRTGYTGEDGFEIYASPAVIVAFWDELVGSGRALPCGLGCRDTLRFEVGLPLYGDEIIAEIKRVHQHRNTESEQITAQATLKGKTILVAEDMAVNAEIMEMILEMREMHIDVAENGKIAVEKFSSHLPGHYSAILMDMRMPVGEVTTGYHAISVDKSVAMAFVKSDFSALDTEVLIQIRRRTFLAKVVRKQFFKKSYKK